MDNWNVQTFLDTLKAAQSRPKSNEPKGPSLRKVYLCVPENLGRYMIWPMNSTVTGMPFEYLYRTREVNIPEKNSENPYNRWYKLLPTSAYRFVDNSGRLVSSLTSAQVNLLESAHGIFDQLFSLMPEQNRKDVCRYKNYAIGNAYVINRYGADPLKPVESKFSALLVCSSKDFARAIDSDVDLQMINHRNDPSWTSEVYNRQVTGRTGWLMFTVNNAPTGIGFVCSASHCTNMPADNENVIPEADVALMEDPIRNFLGWQAGDAPNNFNEAVITRAIEEMNMMIAKLSSPSVSYSVNPQTQPVPAPTPMTNDPMLGQVMPQEAPMLNPGAMNPNPFMTPPSAQLDPMTQVAQPQAQPQPQAFANGYQQPAFAQQAQAVNPQVNPFDSFQANPYKQQ